MCRIIHPVIAVPWRKNEGTDLRISANYGKSIQHVDIIDAKAHYIVVKNISIC